jgi:hypothetical protein
MTGNLYKILTHRLGLHQRCNERLGNGKLCGKDTVQWYVTSTKSKKLLQAYSNCSKHAFEEPYLKSIISKHDLGLCIFTSWDEVKVWEIMQS